MCICVKIFIDKLTHTRYNKYIKNREEIKMMKVTGLNLIEEMVAERELEKKIKRDIKKDQIKQLVAQGIDKELAKVMVESFQSVGLA